MGLLMKIVGERAFGPALDGMDDMRKAKVKEWYEKAEIKIKAGAPARGGGAPASAAAAPAAKPVAKKVS